MLTVYKGVFQSQEVMVIILIELRVELQRCKHAINRVLLGYSYQVKDRYLHHTLVEICRPILDYLYCHYFLGFQVLAFYDLTKRSLTENIQDQVPISNIMLAFTIAMILDFQPRNILMTSLLRPKNVIYVKYIVTVFVVEPIVFDTFAGLCEDSARIS